VKKLLLLLLVVSAIYLNYDTGNTFIFFKIRLPRFMLAFYSGGVLALVGYIYQKIFSNPLAEPYVLGVSSGAALGSAIAYILGLLYLMPIFGFVGGLMVMIFVWFIAGLGGGFSNMKLILTGVIINFFVYSLISVIIFFTSSLNVMSILMGSLNYIFQKQEFVFFCIFYTLSFIIIIRLFTLYRYIEILSLGDELAQSMGVNVRKTQKEIFILSSIIIGFITSYVGIIAFVGLIVPNIMRIFGRKSLLECFLWGVIFLLICDFFCQHLLPVELPIGIVTSVLGCFGFIFIISQKREF